MLLAGAGLVGAAGTAAASASADPDLQGAGRVRRGRRARHRRAGPVRPRPDEGRLPGLRGRQAADHLQLLAGRHPGRTRRPAALRRAPDRARRARRTSGRSTAASTSWSSTICTSTRCARSACKNAARQFIERNLGANDLMAVISTGGRSHDAQEFTSNKRLLLAAVDKFMGRKLQSATLAPQRRVLPPGRRAIRRRASTIPIDTERASTTRASMLSTLQAGGRVVRRRARPPQDDAASSARASTTTSPTSSAATTRRTSSADDDPRRHPRRDRRDGALQRQHLRHRSARADRRSATRHDRRRPASPIRTTRRPGIGIGSTAATSCGMSQDSLRPAGRRNRRLRRRSTATSSRTAFDRIVRDNSSYYVLAYYPPIRQARRQVPQDRGRVNRPGPHRPVAPRLRARRSGKPAPQTSQDRRACRRSCSRRSTARCR